MKISIVGTGNMAGAIAQRLGSAGHDLQILSRNPDQVPAGFGDRATEAGGTTTVDPVDQPVTGDVVVLATPFEATLDFGRQRGPELADKIVVDIANPIDFEKFRMITPPVKSAAEFLAETLPPTASVVKAFNTTFASTIRAGAVAGYPLTVFVAGDSSSAKETVVGLVRDMRLTPVDAGGIEAARTLEAVQFLHIGVQAQIGASYDSALAIVVPAPAAG